MIAISTTKSLYFNYTAANYADMMSEIEDTLKRLFPILICSIYNSGLQPHISYLMCYAPIAT